MRVKVFMSVQKVKLVEDLFGREVRDFPFFFRVFFPGNSKSLFISLDLPHKSAFLSLKPFMTTLLSPSSSTRPFSSAGNSRVFVFARSAPAKNIPRRSRRLCST